MCNFQLFSVIAYGAERLLLLLLLLFLYMREKARERERRRKTSSICMFIWNAFFSNSHPFRVEMCDEIGVCVCVCLCTSALCMYVVIILRNPKCRQFSVDPNNKHFFFYFIYAIPWILLNDANCKNIITTIAAAVVAATTTVPTSPALLFG